MRTLRIFLQLLISFFGFVALVPLYFEKGSLSGALYILFFMILLLALTALLKDETETRTLPFKTNGNKPIGIILLLLGVSAVYFGFSYFVGSESLPSNTGSCRAICSLIKLATQCLGETTGRLLAGIIWFTSGLFLFFLAIKLLVKEQPNKNI